MAISALTNLTAPLKKTLQLLMMRNSCVDYGLKTLTL